jgi:MoaA/NifB/PqqE/SkfB family radical SAM enzyme
MRSLEFEKDRQVNEILKELDLTYLYPRLMSKPMQAWLRVCTACDLKCPLCERQHITPVDSGFMDFGRFQALVRTMAGMKLVFLFGLGEPFLNKKFFDYVAECHARGLEVSTTTHGMHVDEACGRKIIESGMEEVVFSVDAASPELFNRLRKGADFEKVCHNIRLLNRMKKEMGSQLPRIQLACTLSSENLHEIPQVLQLAHQLEAVGMIFADLTPAIPEHKSYNVFGTPEAEEIMQQVTERGKELGLDVLYFHHNPDPFPGQEEFIPAPGGYGCAMAWTNLVVDRLGTTKFCCYIKDPLPSAFGQKAFDAMNSDQHVKIRQSLIDGRLRRECQGCPGLYKNTPDHVYGLLHHVGRLIEQSDLDLSAKKELHSIQKKYRGKADQVFGPGADPCIKKGFRGRIKDLLPAQVRRLLKRPVSPAG